MLLLSMGLHASRVLQLHVCRLLRLQAGRVLQQHASRVLRLQAARVLQLQSFMFLHLLLCKLESTDVLLHWVTRWSERYLCHCAPYVRARFLCMLYVAATGHLALLLLICLVHSCASICKGWQHLLLLKLGSTDAMLHCDTRWSEQHLCCCVCVWCGRSCVSILERAAAADAAQAWSSAAMHQQGHSGGQTNFVHCTYCLNFPSLHGVCWGYQTPGGAAAGLLGLALCEHWEGPAAPAAAQA
jgi:hypothetical protein